MVSCSCSEGDSLSDNNGVIVALSTLLAVAVIALIISIVINIVQHKQQSRCVTTIMQSVRRYCKTVCCRYDISQSNLRSRINQSLSGNNRYDVEQSRYSEVKQSASGNNIVTDSTIRKPLKSSEPEYETVTDSKPAECANNESWL